MHHEVLWGDGRLTDLKCWNPWFNEVGKAREAFAKAMDFDPMLNETASMGVLASAASGAGMLALTEYVCRKRAAHDGRQFRNGRADLWVYDPRKDRSWAFEAKQLHCTQQIRLPTLQAKLTAACRDAADIPHWEARHRFGMLVVTLPTEELSKAAYDAIGSLTVSSFATFRVDGGDLPCLIFIDRAHRPRKPTAKAVPSSPCRIELQRN